MPERSSSVLRDLGGARAFGVAAHAVAGNQQCGLLGDRHGDAILVGVARQTDFCVFDPQASSRAFG